MLSITRRAIVALFISGVLSLSAQSLTPAQIQTLRTDILADPAFASVPNNDDGHFAIAAAYNQQASPNFTVWKTSVFTKDVFDGLNWTEFIARSAGERDAFTLMMRNGVINPSRPNIRQGLNDIFSGAGGANTRTALLAIFKRLTTRAEKLFAAGTGSDATPATMTFEGSLSYQDVAVARNQ